VPSFTDFRDACVAAGEDEWPGARAVAHQDVHAYVGFLNEVAEAKNLPEGWVVSDTFWIVENETVVGELQIRHELTPFLSDVGGNIGYTVHPGYRSRGIATWALREALKLMAAHGEREAIVTCLQDNAASARVIEKCGGMRDADSVTDGRRRYIVRIA
jgi:predicted acetyltransferase